MDNRQGNVHSDTQWIVTGLETSYIRGPDSYGSFSIPARALNISWGNNPRYWEWIKLNEIEAKLTGSEEAAMLQQVNWLEIAGKFHLPVTSPRSYTVSYMIKFKEDAFGWSHAPVKFKVKLHGDDEGVNWENTETRISLQRYVEKPGVWHQMPGGEFLVTKAEAVTVEVGMFEVDSDWWKGSMILGGITIKPN